MNELLRQLMAMSPAIGAGLSGQGPEANAFMEGFMRTSALLQENKRRNNQDQLALQDRDLAMQDRQRQITRQESADLIAAEERARAGEVNKQQDFIRSQQAAGGITDTASAFEDPAQAQAYIESMMPNLMSVFGQGAIALGQPSVNLATQTITGRQKKQVEAFVEQALKTSYVADNPDADPEMVQLPEHISRIIGKPSARLSELQRFAQLPVGKPAEKKVPAAPFNLSPGQTRFDGTGKPIASLSDRPKSTEPSLMQVSEIDPQTGEVVTSLVPKVAGEVSRKPKQTSEGERKAAAFYRQMESAIKTMDELENSLTETELFQIQSLPQEALIGLANRNKLSENAKRYMRAFEQFTEARLRPVSGAAIADSEFARDRRTYARQFGETPALNSDRRAARQTALESLGEMAGTARPRQQEAAPPSTPSTPNTQGRKAAVKGERRIVNGALHVWSGVKWEPVKF